MFKKLIITILAIIGVSRLIEEVTALIVVKAADNSAFAKSVLQILATVKYVQIDRLEAAMNEEDYEYAKAVTRLSKEL